MLDVEMADKMILLILQFRNCLIFLTDNTAGKNGDGAQAAGS